MGSYKTAGSNPEQPAAAAEPIPVPAVATSPAPGKTGPAGMAPRTNYSRVNTGSPPPPDAGSAGQKAQPPRGLEMLPKFAGVSHSERILVNVMKRPNLHDLVKEAMEGTAAKVDISIEANRQLANLTGAPAPVEKTASAKTTDSLPTEYLHKLASALDYIADGMCKAAGEGTPTTGVGKGPNTLEVLEAKAEGRELEPGQSGTATSAHVPPKNPPMQSSGVAHDASTAMKDNGEMMHGKAPLHPMGKNASLEEKNAGVMAKLARGKYEAVDKAVYSALGKAGDFASKHKGTAAGTAVGAAGGYAVGHHTKGKEASLLEKNLAVLGIKQAFADDGKSVTLGGSAGNAQGADAPVGAAASGEQVPGEPGDVSSQKNMIASNEAAINYTKGQAKRDPKSDLAKVLTEPALSAAHDTVLQKAFAHTGQAGVKIAADLTRTAAAQALLSKLAAAAEEKGKKKEKDSMMGGLTSPSGQSGFSAASTG